MASPALQKTWQGGSTGGGTEFVNVAVPGVVPKEVLFAIKEAKIGFNSNPWTVIGSSDGVGASMNGTDRWIDSGDIISWSPGNPRSWIVLQQTALGATFHCLLYTLDTTADFDGNDLGVIYNEGGFGVANGGTDGTASVLPTPSDTSKNFSPPSTDWCGAEGGAPTAKVLTSISSTDGECTRFLISKQSTGLPINMWGIEVPRFPPSEWTVPVVTYMFKSTVASGLSCLRWETMQSTFSNMRGLLGVPGGGSVIASGFVPQGPMFSTVEVIDLQEDDRPNPMLYPVRLQGGIAEGTVLNHGTLFDFYWCSRNPAGKHLLDMDSIPAPADATPQNAVFFPDDDAVNPPSSLEISDAAQTGLEPLDTITLEVWAHVSSYGETNNLVLMDKADGFNRAYSFELRTSGGFLLFSYRDGVGFNNRSQFSVATGITALGNWHHFAVTREKVNGETRFYLNGAPLGPAQVLDVGAGLDGGGVEQFKVGHDKSYFGDFHGHIAEVRVWSVTRTPAEILANYNAALVGNEAGLEGYWPFHTDFNDLTSNANHLTAIAGGATAAPSIDPIARPFAGNIVAPRTFVCVGDPVIGWLDDGATDLSYT